MVEVGTIPQDFNITHVVIATQVHVPGCDIVVSETYTTFVALLVLGNISSREIVFTIRQHHSD